MQGMDLPVVYNSSGYEKLETLKLAGRICGYLPSGSEISGSGACTEIFLCAGLCGKAAKAAIGEMVRQTVEIVSLERMDTSGKEPLSVI